MQLITALSQEQRGSLDDVICSKQQCKNWKLFVINDSIIILALACVM